MPSSWVIPSFLHVLLLSYTPKFRSTSAKNVLFYVYILGFFFPPMIVFCKLQLPFSTQTFSTILPYPFLPLPAAALMMSSLQSPSQLRHLSLDEETQPSLKTTCSLPALSPTLTSLQRTESLWSGLGRPHRPGLQQTVLSRSTATVQHQRWPAVWEEAAGWGLETASG